MCLNNSLFIDIGQKLIGWRGCLPDECLMVRVVFIFLQKLLFCFVMHKCTESRIFKSFEIDINSIPKRIRTRKMAILLLIAHVVHHRSPNRAQSSKPILVSMSFPNEETLQSIYHLLVPESYRNGPHV